jgi:hypothetical protein
MRASALLIVSVLLGCSLGERGGREEPVTKKVAAAVPATAKVGAGKGTCAATVDKLVALSMIDAEANGQAWSAAQRAQKHKMYLDRCTRELADGVVTRDAMLCVEGSKDLGAARECLLAIAK